MTGYQCLFNVHYNHIYNKNIFVMHEKHIPMSLLSGIVFEKENIDVVYGRFHFVFECEPWLDE